ncbi:MAG: ComEC family competence protein [Bacteroidia bacterium]|nr:ComEC family competence protein [Bacteroidia bacterium]GIV24031.1 MAG: hypothetical protein KatS3mg025_1690 [Bacteroidia bacterium]
MAPWRYPLLWAAAGLAVGIWLEATLGIGGVAGLVALVPIAWWIDKRIGYARLAWTLPLMGSLGYLRSYTASLEPGSPIKHLRGHLVRLTGYTTEAPFRSRKTYRLVVEAESAYAFFYQQAFPVTGTLLLYVRDSTVATLPIGTRIRAIVRLDSVRYNASYWQRQGITVSAFADSVASAGIAWGYGAGYIKRLRQRLIQAIEAHFPGEGSPLALIEALLLGYTRGLDPETRAAFQLSGTAHILAVSGMHVSLVLMLWLFLLRQLPPRWSFHPISQSVLIGLIVFYGFLTGAAPSAMRAVLMGSVAILARMFHKPYFPLNALGFAAFVQLSVDPQVLFNLGFLLSYAAVGGIMAYFGLFRALLSGHQPRRKKEKAWVAYLKDLIAISLAAQIGTLFLSWSYFGKFPAYFLLANLVAVPLSTALTFAAVGWVALLWVPVLREGIGWAVYGLAYALITSVKGLSLLPGASLSLPPLSPWAGVPLTLAALGMGAYLHHRYKKAQETPWLV